MSSPPKNGTPTIRAWGADDRLYCAARFGDNHSVASWFHAQDTFVGQFLGGNTVSGLADIYLNIKGASIPSLGDLAQVALGGAGQGLPSVGHAPGWDGAAGIAVDGIVRAGSSGVKILAPKLAATAGQVGAKIGVDAVSAVGWGQLIYDTSTFLVGLAKCW